MNPARNRIVLSIVVAAIASPAVLAQQPQQQHIVSVGPVLPANDPRAGHVVGPITAFQVQQSMRSASQAAPPPAPVSPVVPAPAWVQPYPSTVYILLGDDASPLTFGGMASPLNLGASTDSGLSSASGPGSNQYALPGGAMITAPPSQSVVVAGPPSASVTNIYNQYTTNNYYGADARSAPASADRDGASPAMALRDIARSWMRGDVSLLKGQMSADQQIDILSAGTLHTSVSADKLASATDELYDRIVTRSFEFDVPRTLADGSVRAVAKHVFAMRSGASGDPDRTLYIAYTLRRIAYRWIIVSVDTSTARS